MSLEGDEGLADNTKGSQMLCATQFGQIDHEQRMFDMAAGFAHQPDRGASSASGGEEIVDNDDPLPNGNGVRIKLEPVGAIFERIFGRDRGYRQLARLAYGYER